MATGTILGGFAATGALSLTLSLALSLAAGILVRWLIRRTGTTQSLAEGAEALDASARLWQRHVHFAALEVRDHLDAAAFAVLRKAFQPAVAMHPIRLLSR